MNGERADLPGYVIGQGADKGEFNYFSPAATQKAYSNLGFGLEGRLIGAVYVKDDGSLAVGVMATTAEQYRDHFRTLPIVRGVDQLKAMGQTRELLTYFAPDSKTSGPEQGGFTSVQHAVFNSMILPPHAVNVAVERQLPDNSRLARAVILSGETVVAKAILVQDTGSYELVSTKDSVASEGLVIASDERVREILQGLGYGPSMMRLNRVVEQGGQRVGILDGSLQLAGGKNVGEVPIFSVMEGVEAIPQLQLVLGVLDGSITGDAQPLFTGIEQFQSRHPLRAGLGLSIDLTISQGGKREISAIGEFRHGQATIGAATIGGVVVPRRVFDTRMVAPRQKEQQGETLIFPLI